VHRNIKFFRGESANLSVADLCRAATDGIEQIVTGLSEPVSAAEALDYGIREREAKDLVAAL